MRKTRPLVVLLLLFLMSLSGDTKACDGYCVYLPIIKAFNPYRDTDNMSDWKIIVPEFTQNKVLNPSAEIAGNFAAGGGATVTRSTTIQHYGRFSYRLQTAADDDGIELTLGSLANEIHFVTVRVNGTIGSPTVWDWSLDNITYTSPVFLFDLDDDWALYGLQFPAAQANASTTLYIDQNGGGAGVLHLDGIQVEEKEYWTTFCDGTQEGCEWLGAAHASTSQRSADSTAGGRVQDLQSDYGLNISAMQGAGAAPIALGIDGYATLPGGELNTISTDVRPYTLTAVIQGTSLPDFHAKKQVLTTLLSADAYPGEQPVRFNYTGAAVQKQLDVYYKGGLGGNISTSTPDNWEQVTISFESPSPHWLEIGESTAELDTNDSATFGLIAARLRSTGQWDDLGSPTFSGAVKFVESIARSPDGKIILAGNFDNFAGIANADNIVMYDPLTGTYSALDTGLNGRVNKVAYGPDGTLYAAGFMTNASGDANADYFIKFDGTVWSAVGIPNTGSAAITSVVDFAFTANGNIIIAGDYTDWANISNADNVVMWNVTTATYSAIGTGLNDVVNAVVVRKSTNEAFLAGSFTDVVGGPGGTYNRIIMLDIDTSTYSALGTGSDTLLVALALSLDESILYFGGSVVVFDGVTVNSIGGWNGTSAFAMAGGTTGGGINQIAPAPDGTLLVVGDFLTIGEITTSDRYARWNGYAWAHFDSNLPGSTTVHSLMIGLPDPVVNGNYDTWIGLSIAGGTGTFAGKATVTNEGNAPAFPKIVYNRTLGTTAIIKTLRNERTAKEILFDYGLLNGESLTIDLAPTQKSIVSSQFGARLDAYLANSDFDSFSLLTGDQDITSFVDVTGAPTIGAHLIWKDAYLGQD